MAVELDNTGAARAAVALVLDFRALDGADGLEELDEVFVAGAPGELGVSDIMSANRVFKTESGEVRRRSLRS